MTEPTTYIDEQGFVEELLARLKGIPEAEWPEHATEEELAVLERQRERQGRRG